VNPNSPSCWDEKRIWAVSSFTWPDLRQVFPQAEGISKIALSGRELKKPARLNGGFTVFRYPSNQPYSDYLTRPFLAEGGFHNGAENWGCLQIFAGDGTGSGGLGKLTGTAIRGNSDASAYSEGIISFSHRANQFPPFRGHGTLSQARF